MPSRSAYAKAGVDIQLGNQVKETLPSLLASTHRPEVLGKVGGFGGLFAPNFKKFKRPVLVSSVDGVGTKLKVAFQTRRHDTIGEDLVNHCVNDILVLGAEPLFFLDYVGAGTLKPSIFDEIIRGFARGCQQNGCALIGGETAQMPGFYQKGEYDVSGTIVGVVDHASMVDGRRTESGDVVLGLEASGLHTNGYSLARRILFDQAKLRTSSRIPECGETVGDALMKVHRSYFKAVHPLLKRYNLPRKSPKIKAMAHITGGGFQDNIPRSLPSRFDARVELDRWPTPPLFQYLAKAGKVSQKEMFHVFNMGIGLTMTVHPSIAKSCVQSLKRRGHQAWPIGTIVQGKGQVQLV